jgi:LEA14-like dessication related protein
MISLTRLTVLLALSMGLLLSGCATAPDQELLDVKLVNLRFTQSRVLETDAVFTIRIENESPEALRITGGVHKFYIEGTLIGKGMSNETIEVPRLSSVTQEITVHLSNVNMARKIKPMIENRKVQSKADSLLYCEMGGQEQRIRVAHEGTLDVNEFVPEKQAPSIRQP